MNLNKTKKLSETLLGNPLNKAAEEEWKKEINPERILQMIRIIELAYILADRFDEELTKLEALK